MSERLISGKSITLQSDNTGVSGPFTFAGPLFGPPTGFAVTRSTPLVSTAVAATGGVRADAIAATVFTYSLSGVHTVFVTMSGLKSTSGALSGGSYITLSGGVGASDRPLTDVSIPCGIQDNATNQMGVATLRTTGDIDIEPVAGLGWTITANCAVLTDLTFTFFQ